MAEYLKKQSEKVLPVADPVDNEGAEGRVFACKLTQHLPADTALLELVRHDWISDTEVSLIIEIVGKPVIQHHWAWSLLGAQIRNGHRERERERKRKGKEKGKGEAEREIGSEALAETEKIANAPAGN